MKIQHKTETLRKYTQVKAKTTNQEIYLDLIRKNDIVFCDGPAGSGKSYCAIGFAIEKLLNEELEQIVIAKPLIEAEKEIGALPGTLGDKTEYHFGSLLETFKCFITCKELEDFVKKKKIRFLPIGFWRGHTFNNSAIIIDESQNLLINQFKLAVTRIGYKSKTIFCGDSNQSDLKIQPIFSECIQKLKLIDGVGCIQLTYEDIVRNDIIAKILKEIS